MERCMGRIVWLVAIVSAISLLVVYAASRRTATEEWSEVRVPPILEDSKRWVRNEPVMFIR